MKLFDKIPENFFSILVSKNKNIYVDALFVLGEAYDQELSISKENIISRLINNLEDDFEVEDFSEEEDSELKEDNVSSKAYFLLRKLKWAGWIEFEMQRDTFEENVTLPAYSSEFIKFLRSIVQEEKAQFTTRAFSTYSSLKIASTDKSETYNAINAAYQNTMELNNELKSLYHNIGRFHKKMIIEDNINEIIRQHFFEYKEYSDEIIFSRFTRDSVLRYKVPIRKMLNDILADNELLEETIERASQKSMYKTKEEAENDIMSKIRSVIDVYENIEYTMSQIEKKNTDYVRASVQRMQYLLTSDKELKGKLVNILKNSKKEQVLEKMQDEVNLFTQEYIDKDSIYIRNSNDKRKQGKPLPVQKTDVTDMELYKEFAKSLEKRYSNKKINDFMKKNFGDKPFITAEEMDLQTTEDLILLILATVKGERTEKSFYYVQDNNEIVNNNGFKIPNMKFIRRN